MSKSVGYCLLTTVGIFLLALTFLRPALLSDGNTFLAGFVNQNILGILGVILTITLASAAQIHLALNDVETRRGRLFLHKTRAGVRVAAYWLIWQFLAAVVVVLIKPYFLSLEGQSFFNCAALFILFWMVLIMASLMQLVFALKPHFEDHQDA